MKAHNEFPDLTSQSRREFLISSASAVGLGALAATGMFENVASGSLALDPSWVQIENEHFLVSVDRQTGAITRLLVKRNGGELVGEPRLASLFRINLPLPANLSHYLETGDQRAQLAVTDDRLSILYPELVSPSGRFPIALTLTIRLDQETVRFASHLVNRSEYPVAEFWYPRIGGWTRFGAERGAQLSSPGYAALHRLRPFQRFPGVKGLGAEAAEWTQSYFRAGPDALVMPWWSLHDPVTDTGLYLGYHDTTFRFSTWHAQLWPNVREGRANNWPTPDEAEGLPVGLVFSHVRFPQIASGEMLAAGEFVLRVHPGDWHMGSRFYREWFVQHWPLERQPGWLRRQRTWFSSIIYQPEDKVVADYSTFGRWTERAHAAGINCHELIGWDQGGLERDYPHYVPEPRLGGAGGFQKLLRDVASRGDKCLVFVNYNVLDQATAEYRDGWHRWAYQDQFGLRRVWMNWGQGTLLARQAHSVRRHVVASIVPELETLLEEHILRLVAQGVSALQIDKVVACSVLDWNPLNTRKPDTALFEGLVVAVERLVRKARAINPDFRLASEAGQDRLIPFWDVGYRNVSAADISPLRYVFPEWTACRHISTPGDYNGVNTAVMLGAVICYEPAGYQAPVDAVGYRRLTAYLAAVERLRARFEDILFLGKYLDTTGGRVVQTVQPPANFAARAAVAQEDIMASPAPVDSQSLLYRLHANDAGRRALVVCNRSQQTLHYTWSLDGRQIAGALLATPTDPDRTVRSDQTIGIAAEGLHVLVEDETSPGR